MSLQSSDDNLTQSSIQRMFTLGDKIEDRFLTLVKNHSLQLLRYALITVFVWFGLLTMSGVNQIAGLIAEIFWMIPETTVNLLLGGWEITIGLTLLSRRSLRVSTGLMMAYVTVIMLPLIFFPTETFSYFPYGPSFEGVYILKDWVLLGGVMTVGGLFERTS